MYITPRTVALTKRPTARNLKNGSVCVYQDEVDAIAEFVECTTVVVDVFDSFGNHIISRTFSAQEFLLGLRPWRKTTGNGYWRSLVK
jgi:hypothetical protein